MVAIDPTAGIGSESDHPKRKYYKLGNQNISGEKHPCYGHLYETSTNEQVSIENAVVLHLASGRSYTVFRKGHAPDTKCQSFNGLEPAKRIPSPFCKKTSEAEVGDYLKERAELYNIKALDAAQIKNIQAGCCSNGELTTCGYTTDKGKFFPLCMHAIPDGSKNCQEKLTLHGYNLDTEELFWVDLSPSNLVPKGDWPLVKFIRGAYKQGVPYHHFSVSLGGHIPENGFVKLDITSAYLIEDETLLAKIKELREAELEGIKNRQDWVLEDKDSPSGKDAKASEGENGEQAQGLLGDEPEFDDELGDGIFT